MPDFKELFTDPVFDAYQDAIVDEVVNWLESKLKFGVDAKVLLAGMDIAKAILELPTKLKATLQVEQRLQAAVKAKLIGIPAALLRRELYEKFKDS